MTHARQRANVAVLLTAIVASIAVGASVGTGHYRLIGLVLAGILGIVVAGALIVRTIASPRTAVFVIGAASVALMAENGLRFNPSTTYSDLLLVIAGMLIVMVTIIGRDWISIPSWLIVGGSLILVSAIIVELIPPQFLSSDLLDLVQAKNLQTGVTGQSTNPVMVARLLIAVVVAPLLVGLIPTTWKQGRLLVTLWLAGVAISCVVGILASLTPVDLQQTLTGVAYAQARTGSFAGRASGLTVHPAALGLSAALALPVAFSRMVTVSRGIRYLPLVIVFVLATLVSGSRSAVALCGVGFVIVFAWQYHARRQLVLIAGGTTLLGVLLWPTIASLSSVQRLLGGTGVAGQPPATSDTGHASRVAEGLHVFFQRPIGYGYQAIRGAHDVALQLLDSGGPLGFLGYSVIIYGAVRLGFAVRRRVPAWVEPDATGLMASLGVWVASTLINNSSYDRYTYLPIGLLLAMFFISKREERKSAAAALVEEPSPAPLPRLHQGRTRPPRPVGRADHPSNGNGRAGRLKSPPTLLP